MASARDAAVAWLVEDEFITTRQARMLPTVKQMQAAYRACVVETCDEIQVAVEKLRAAMASPQPVNIDGLTLSIDRATEIAKEYKDRERVLCKLKGATSEREESAADILYADFRDIIMHARGGDSCQVWDLATLRENYRFFPRVMKHLPRERLAVLSR